MNLVTLALGGLAVFATIGLAAEPAPGPPGNPPPVRDAAAMQKEAAARQRAALAEMQTSLEKQRLSLELQGVRPAPGSFFLLPPPEPMPADGRPLRSADCDPLPASRLDPLIQGEAARAGIGADLLRSVMKQESDFRPCAVSEKGAQGLMQLMPDTAARFGVSDPFDATSNVNAGARLLKELLVRYGGDLSLALGAYNAGAGRVDKTGGVPEIPETTRYVQQILSTLAPNQ